MPHSTTNSSQQLEKIRRQIATAAQTAKRDASTIQLLAVSKGQPLEKLLALHSAGQQAFGESYLQEALDKIRQLTEKNIEWHFIGRLQSNKLGQIAAHFDWVHSLSSIDHARKLNLQRSPTLAPINICIQVNLSNEVSKSGIVVAQLEDMVNFVVSQPHLKLRGLMTMPDPSVSDALQQTNYHSLRRMLSKLNRDGLNLDTLSMGMSNDYPAAIAEGATIVRVGTALFGPREIKKT